MEADARGIRVVSAVSDGRFDWQVLDRFAENDRVFLLVQQGGRVFFPVSKRQMMPAEVEEFRSLCTMYILHS